MIATQPPLPTFAPAPPRPGRRCSWRQELARALQLIADQRARHEQRHAEALARLAGQVMISPTGLPTSSAAPGSLIFAARR